MARFSQGQFEQERAARGFDDEQALRAALAALEGVEGKEAKQERQFLERRLEGLVVHAQRRAESEAQSPAEILAEIPR